MVRARRLRVQHPLDVSLRERTHLAEDLAGAQRAADEPFALNSRSRLETGNFCLPVVKPEDVCEGRRQSKNNETIFVQDNPETSDWTRWPFNSDAV
jgi:hypothetical protein